MKRFWKLASVQSLPNQRFSVTLDGKTLKTPNGSPLLLSSSPLATLVATEWQTFQPPFRSHSLPLVSFITIHVSLL
jgi:chaperone required for assembly of F1-ATPase